MLLFRQETAEFADSHFVVQLVSCSVMIGQIIPLNVPTPLEIPIRMEAYLKREAFVNTYYDLLV